MAAQLSPDDLRGLKDKVFHGAKDNEPQVIQDCLASLHPDVVKDVLHHCSTHEDSQPTPLIIAAWNGHLEVVKLLVNDFNVDVNQKASGSFEMHHALISAICQGLMDIVKVLIRKGCDINAASSDGHTAVYFACSTNRLDILKYLVDNGAKICNPSPHDSSTYLEIACCKENQEMVEYLLSKGADLNQQNDDGRTALHKAAENNSRDIITLLLHHGAKFSKDKRGRSPLMESALKPSSDAVKVFLESADLTQLERIEGLELLGATLAETNVDGAFMYVRQAMTERHKNPDNVLSKPYSTLPTFSNVRESQTLEELQARQSDRHLFRLECLAILSRILGPNDCVTVHSFKAYSDELQSAGRDSEAKAVFLHGMKAAVKCFTSPATTTLALQQLLLKFVELLRNGKLFFSDLGGIMELILDMMEKNEALYFGSLFVCRIWLCYVLLALKVAQGQEEGRRLQRLVERFICLTSGSPVLHTAVCLNWSIPDCLRDVDELKCDLLVPFMLECGADVHVKDDDKNTALHIVAWCSDNFPDSDLVSQVAKTLLDAGALVGVENFNGQTPLDMAGPALAAELRELYPVSLKSLAATFVVKYNIPYVEEVPKDLAEFTDKH